MSAWIAVDLDGTLATYNGWKGEDHIGEPIPAMVDRVKAWLAERKDVRIFTARMAGHGRPVLDTSPQSLSSEIRTADVVTPIEDWCLRHIGQKLPVTNIKDFSMIELWDDRAIAIEHNTGRILGGFEDKHPL